MFSCLCSKWSYLVSHLPSLLCQVLCHAGYWTQAFLNVRQTLYQVSYRSILPATINARRVLETITFAIVTMVDTRGTENWHLWEGQIGCPGWSNGSQEDQPHCVEVKTYLRCEYVTVSCCTLHESYEKHRETPFLLQPLATLTCSLAEDRSKDKLEGKSLFSRCSGHKTGASCVNTSCQHSGVHVTMGEGLNVLSFISAAVIEVCDWKQLRGGKDLFHLVGHRPTLRELGTGSQAGPGSRNSRGTLLVGSLTDQQLKQLSSIFFFLIFRTWRFYFYLEKKCEMYRWQQSPTNLLC